MTTGSFRLLCISRLIWAVWCDSKNVWYTWFTLHTFVKATSITDPLEMTQATDSRGFVFFLECLYLISSQQTHVVATWRHVIQTLNILHNPQYVQASRLIHPPQHHYQRRLQVALSLSLLLRVKRIRTPTRKPDHFLKVKRAGEVVQKWTTLSLSLSFYLFLFLFFFSLRASLFSYALLFSQVLSCLFVHSLSHVFPLSLTDCFSFFFVLFLSTILIDRCFF